MKKDGIQTRKRKPKNPSIGGFSQNSSSKEKGTITIIGTIKILYTNILYNLLYNIILYWYLSMS